MSHSNNSSSSVWKTVAIVAGTLLLFTFILRAALAPLYQEVAQAEMRGDSGSGGDSGGGGGGGGGSSSGGSGGGENVNVNLGGFGGLLNWAFGWAWGGPGWHNAGPDGGWWGGNWWNNWNGRWDNNGNWWDRNGRVWNNTVNNTYDRNVNNEINRGDVQRNDNVDRGARDEFRGEGDDVRGGGGREEFHGGGGGREEFRGGGGFHGGGGRR